MDKKKAIIIAVAVVLVAALAFLIYWNATEFDRERNREMKYIQEQFDEYREGKNPMLPVVFDDELINDAEFQEFLTMQVREMCENGEARLLNEFLSGVEHYRKYYVFLQDAVTEGFGYVKTIEDAFYIKEELRLLDYYNEGLKLTLQSPVIASHIEEHGTNDITVTPGEGYYANEKDSSWSKTLVDGLPLFDAEEITYFGDFKCRHSYGVRLSALYQEENYSSTTYCFRDCYITFPSEQGECIWSECIWSGNYLFCFSSTGELVGFTDEIAG